MERVGVCGKVVGRHGGEEGMLRVGDGGGGGGGGDVW